MMEKRIEFAMPMDWKRMSQEKGKLVIIFEKCGEPSCVWNFFGRDGENRDESAELLDPF
jgi:hypothetical protein